MGQAAQSCRQCADCLSVIAQCVLLVYCLREICGPVWALRIVQIFAGAVVVAAVIQLANGGFGAPEVDILAILISVSALAYSLFVLDLSDQAVPADPEKGETGATKQPKPEETAARPILMLR